jgi:hypothetical protein
MDPFILASTGTSPINRVPEQDPGHEQSLSANGRFANSKVAVPQIGKKAAFSGEFSAVDLRQDPGVGSSTSPRADDAPAPASPLLGHLPMEWLVEWRPSHPPERQPAQPHEHFLPPRVSRPRKPMPRHPDDGIPAAQSVRPVWLHARGDDDPLRSVRRTRTTPLRRTPKTGSSHGKRGQSDPSLKFFPSFAGGISGVVHIHGG